MAKKKTEKVEWKWYYVQEVDELKPSSVSRLKKLGAQKVNQFEGYVYLQFPSDFNVHLSKELYYCFSYPILAIDKRKVPRLQLL